MRTQIVLAIALLFGSSVASAQPADPPLDIEVKEVDVRQIFTLLAEVRKAPITVDPCVNAKVDLKLHNTPISMVLTALGSKLHLTYEERGEELLVHCPGVAAAPVRRIGVSQKDAPLPAVIESLAKDAQLGVDYRATKKPTVTIVAENASLPAVLALLADETELSITTKAGKVVVADR